MKFTLLGFFWFALLFATSPVQAGSLPPGQAMIPGGVPYTPVKNQFSSGFCWAYAISAFAEGESMRKKNPETVHLSPTYLGFYNFYYELEDNLSTYASYDPASKTSPYIPDEGSNGYQALIELKNTGMIPALEYPDQIRTDAADKRLTTDLHRFARNDMLNANARASYVPLDEDGINTPLFTALSKLLLRIFPDASLPRPNDTFTYRNQTGLTPKSFMSTVLKFNPDDYQFLTAMPNSHQNFLKLVQAALKANYSIPIAFLIFDDKVKGVDAESVVNKTGIFSEEDCPNQQCSAGDGGHEVLIVNDIEDSSGNVTGFIVKNSWGLTGLDINGQKTDEEQDRGYYVITSEYLRQGFARGFFWDVILPNEILRRPEFSGLQ